MQVGSLPDRGDDPRLGVVGEVGHAETVLPEVPLRGAVEVAVVLVDVPLGGPALRGLGQRDTLGRGLRGIC